MNCGDRFSIERATLDESDHVGHALACEIAFEVAQDIARADPFVFYAAAWFDCNQLFLPARIAHTECGGNGRAPNERADLKNRSGTSFRKMINQEKHIQMQRGIFVPDFEERR